MVLTAGVLHRHDRRGHPHPGPLYRNLHRHHVLHDRPTPGTLPNGPLHANLPDGRMGRARTWTVGGVTV